MTQTTPLLKVLKFTLAASEPGTARLSGRPAPLQALRVFFCFASGFDDPLKGLWPIYPTGILIVESYDILHGPNTIVGL